jgi:hypothetical protein
MKSVLRTYCVFAFAAILCRAQSPVPFAALETPVPPTPMRLVGSGDFDGDGDRDLYGLGRPFVLLNDGDGRFAPLAATPGAAGPPTVFAVDPSRYVVADFDGDGRDDLVFTSLQTLATSAGTLFLATGGTAGFAASALPAPTGPSGYVLSASTADVNSDGLPDLIVGRALPASPGSALYFPAPPDVLLNAGGGAFTPAGALGLVYHTVLGDIDLDGDPDALLNFGGVQFNTGGVFGPIVPIAGGPAPVLGPRLPSVAFLNGDPYPDLVVGSLLVATAAGSVQQVATYYGGSSGFVAGPIVSAPVAITTPFPFGTPFACDSNADGVDELYVPLIGARGLARYDAVGTALVAGPVDPSYAPLSSDLVLDADLDGRDDVVSLAGSASAAVFGAAEQFHYDLRFGAGAAGFPNLVLESGALPSRPLVGGLAVADFDADGDLDLAGVERVGGVDRLAIAVNDGGGTFQWNPAPLFPSGAPVGGPFALHRHLVAGDFDGDGDADLAAIETYPFGATAVTGESTVLRQLSNNGAGGFASATGFLVGTHGAPTRAVVADFDQDGRDDVALQYFGGIIQGLYVAHGSAAGLVMSPAMTSLPTAFDLAAADFDGDGDIDLAAAGAPSALFLNAGGLSFVASPVFGAAAASVVVANDVDFDGDADLWLNETLWTRNGGAWTQVGSAATNAPAGAYPTESFDFEGDGDLDTYVGSGFLHVASGPGVALSFDGPVRTNPACRFVDVDGDGDRDLLYMPISSGTGLRPTGTPRLYLNRARQTTLDAPFRAGRATHVGLHGAPNGLYFLFAALGTTSLAAPPFGTIRLDPASTILVAGGALDATGYADAVGFLPASFSAFAGLEIDLQGVVDTVAGPRLANLRRAVVRNY